MLSSTLVVHCAGGVGQDYFLTFDLCVIHSLVLWVLYRQLHSIPWQLCATISPSLHQHNMCTDTEPATKSVYLKMMPKDISYGPLRGKSSQFHMPLLTLRCPQLAVENNHRKGSCISRTHWVDVIKGEHLRRPVRRGVGDHQETWKRTHSEIWSSRAEGNPSSEHTTLLPTSIQGMQLSSPPLRDLCLSSASYTSHVISNDQHIDWG